VTLVLALGVLAGSAAFGDEGLPITITNDGTEDILVTVYDLNAHSRAPVMQSVRINGFVSVPLSLAAGSDGRGRIAWTAVSVDQKARHCGHGQRMGLVGADTVNVHADGDCAS
jgi:hypothetical protein